MEKSLYIPRRSIMAPRQSGETHRIALDLIEFGGLAPREDISDVQKRFDDLLNDASLEVAASRALASSFDLLHDLSGARRRNGNLIISHGIDVMKALVDRGCKDTDMLIAALLHDYIEDYPAAKGGRLMARQRLLETSVPEGAVQLIQALTDSDDCPPDKNAYYVAKIDAICRNPDPRVACIKGADIFANSMDAKAETRVSYVRACNRLLRSGLVTNDRFDARPIVKAALSNLTRHNPLRRSGPRIVAQILASE